MTANRGDQIERRETGVGDDHDLAIWHRFTEPPAQSSTPERQNLKFPGFAANS